MARRALADVLVRAREKKGLTQVELAQLVKSQQVSLWERAVTIPSGRNIEKLADVLGLSPTKLRDLADAARAAEHQEVRNEAAQARADRDVVLGKIGEFVDQYERLGHTYRSMAADVTTLIERALPLQEVFEGISEQIAQVHQQLVRLDGRLAQLEQQQPPDGPPVAP
jgi:transcriptional regulator with XRE-family HTH domain